MVRYSRQREVICDHVAGRRDHPTAEMVYTSLKEKDPKLSLGTVYRNLSFLANQGRISRIRTEGGPDRYDGNCEEHYHFLCRCCGRIFDIYPPTTDELKILVNGWGDYHAEEVSLHVSGLCPACLKEKPAGEGQETI